MSPNGRPAILVVRRDNIGDLVLTTPFLAALRSAWPQAWIGVLTNDYAAPVLEGNPDIDAVFAYTKLKHIQATGWWDALRQTVRALWVRWQHRCVLRELQLDWVVLATPTADPAAQQRGLALARRLKAQRIIRFTDEPVSLHLDPLAPTVALSTQDNLPEAERVLALLPAMGAAKPLTSPGCRLVSNPNHLTTVRAQLAAFTQRHALTQSVPITRWIGLHLSARKPSQRWSAEHYAELARCICAQPGHGVLLVWSPGAADHKQHPGDDDKAEQVRAACSDLAVFGLPTPTLPTLIAALTQTHALVMPDGGAMHLAAALNKPIVALFGQSDAARWRPWGTSYALLQSPDKQVESLSVATVWAALQSVLAGLPR